MMVTTTLGTAALLTMAQDVQAQSNLIQDETLMIEAKPLSPQTASEFITNTTDILVPYKSGNKITNSLIELSKNTIDTINNVYNEVSEPYIVNFTQMGTAFMEASDVTTKARVAMGIPFSILSGDIADIQPPVKYDPNGPAVIFINGIMTTNSQAFENAQMLKERLGNVNISQVNNSTHYIGDFMQVLAHEFGFIDICAVRTLSAIKQGVQEKGEVYVIAHSQGTAIFEAAIKLVPFEGRKNIFFEGIGGQKYISSDKHNLGMAINIRHTSDPIPYLGNDIKSILMPIKDQCNWELLSEKNKYFIDNHLFENYINSINLPTQHMKGDSNEK